ncbi:MAG: ArnT family glycosyltransferase [Janthinobacterium lividum]
MTKFSASPLPLLCVLLLALALRVWGLTWGLPSATHYFSYHPDESVVLGYASQTMNVFAGHLLPHFYRYGSLQLYLVCFANTLAALFGGVEIVPKDYAVWYPEWAKMYLIGRCLTVGMGVGTVWATYALGLRLWGKRAGLLAALILAITPLHAQHSHFLTVDVPATFWVMLSLLWTVRLATGDSKPLKAALWAGVFAGLAAATKYNMALVILPLIVASFINSSPTRFGRGGACAGVGFLAFVLAFFAACPGALLETNIFLSDFHAEAVHVQNVNDPTFRDTGNGFIYHITHNLDAGLGLPLLLLVLVSIGYALYRRERGDGLLAAFALPYYILIGLAAVRYARYAIPLLPILSLWAGRMVAVGTRESAKIAPGFVKIVSACVLLATFALTLLLIQPMAQIDPRDQAILYLRPRATGANFAGAPFFSEGPIGFPVQPWFGTVPVSPYFTLPRPGAWQAVTSPKTLKNIVYDGQDWDAKDLKAKKPPYVVLSEYDYDDALRLKDPAAEVYLKLLTHNYDRLWMNENTPQFSSRGLPHDMTYTDPIIYIYGRN